MRNLVLPALRKRFKGVDKNIVNFAAICAKDDDYIKSQIDFGTLIEEKNLVRVPLTYFYQNEAVVNRILMKVFSKFTMQDIETRHLNMVRQFALEAENGSIISLPYDVKVSKEYDFIAIGYIKKKTITDNHPFKTGRTKMDGYGTVRVGSTQKLIEPTSPTLG